MAAGRLIVSGGCQRPHVCIVALEIPALLIIRSVKLPEGSLYMMQVQVLPEHLARPDIRTSCLIAE